MSENAAYKERVRRELGEFKRWAEEANMQAHLAKAEASAELRRLWMETEQNLAKLESKLEDLETDVDEGLQGALDSLRAGWNKLKSLRG